MRADAVVSVGAEALSCYTANLATYLSGCREDALDHVARSVRLAVRADLSDDNLAFSHHAVPLNVIDDHSQLAYAAEPDPARALDGVARELADRGQVLVVSNTATMDWSVWSSRPSAAPHFLLIDGSRRGAWHVDDRFAAIHPGGEQRPFAGWISSAALLRCLTPITPLPAHLRLRNQHAFGFPVPLPPDGCYTWLARVPALERDRRARLPSPWVTGIAEVLDLLEGFWSALPARPDRSRVIDDIWAASQHHAFRYARLRSAVALAGSDANALDLGVRAWRDLPMAMHFVVQSTRRGRNRDSLIASTFNRLRQAELAAHEVAAASYSLIGSSDEPEPRPRALVQRAVP